MKKTKRKPAPKANRRPSRPALTRQPPVKLAAVAPPDDLESILQQVDARIATDPQNWDLRGKRAALLMEAQRFEEAEAEARDVIVAAPSNAFARSVLCYRAWRRDDHRAAYHHGAYAVKGEPDNFLNWLGYGIAARTLHKPEGLAALTQATKLNPESAEAHAHLAALLQDKGHLDAAAFMNAKALQMAPHMILAIMTNATIQWRRGDAELAVKTAQHGLLSHPGHNSMANLVAFFAACTDWPEDRIFEATVRAAGHIPGPGGVNAQPVARPLVPNQPLRRIGFIGGDFRRHSVSYFLVPLLHEIVGAGFQVFIYCNTANRDDVSDAIEKAVTGFRTITDSSNHDVAETIRQDGVDILIELSGHTGGNRLPILRHRPAPVQVSYLGYPGTTGLAEFDYRISDHQADPMGPSDAYTTEKIIRLPHGFHCYHPLASLPPLTPPPDGPPIIGSFNASHKYSERLIKAWAEIARRVPDAIFFIKLLRSNDDSFERHFMKKFAAVGMDTDRVQIVRRIAEFSDHLAKYNQLSLSLDTFPYNGTTTTCEALAMGVPVITLRGHRHAARVGASLLTNLGMPELIAETEDAYVDLAVGLLEDRARLVDLRSGLRDRFLASPICDRVAFGRDFVDALNTIWQDAKVLRDRPESPVATTGVPAHTATQGSDATPEQSPAPQPRETMIRLAMPGDIAVSLPDDLNQMTPYALAEQGDWFETEIAFVRRVLEPGMQVIDVGANFGVYTLTMAKAVGTEGHVWSFEPSSRTAGYLADSLAHNNLGNVKLEAAALSDRTGAMPFTKNSHAELNRLTAVDNGASQAETMEDATTEIVPVTTLDAAAQLWGDRRIDVLKLDAEGSEDKIIDGGRDFLSRQSPIIMFESQHGALINDGLAERFAALGFASYVHVPGLNILCPLDPQMDRGSFALNTFAVKPDRAAWLKDRGLLVDGPAPLTSVPAWRGVMQGQPWASVALEKWSAHATVNASGASGPYFDALAHYHASQLPDLTMDQRWGALCDAYALVLKAIDHQATFPRLMLKARLADAMGVRNVAADALIALTRWLRAGDRIVWTEPFVPVAPAFDAIDPGRDLADWIIVSVVESLERLGSYSSYFRPGRSEELLSAITQYRFMSGEAKRRLRLVQARRNGDTKISGIVPTASAPSYSG